MTEILILNFHPDPARSRANRALAAAASALPGTTVREMGNRALAPDFDAGAEVALLQRAGRIVLQFPVQWYAAPAGLKGWLDAVLTRMFYVRPEEGARLSGTPLLVAATAGNVPESYAPGGANLFSLEDLLRPLEVTAHRCGMRWAAPFLLYRANKLDDAALEEAGARYAARLTAWRASVQSRDGAPTRAAA